MNPFFIVGVQRSGTTMLSVLLGNHPDIYMEDKVKAFRLIASYQNMVDLLPHNLNLDTEDFQQWIIDNDKSIRLGELMKSDAISGAQNYREVISKAINHRLIQSKKKVWGDKAPNLQHYISDLLMLIPNAKIIHIVRDGRATAASMTKRTYRNLKLSAQMWVDGNLCGLVNQQVFGEEQYKIIKYEDLVSNPEKEMEQVCGFLNLTYDSSVVKLGNRSIDGNEYVKRFFETSKIDNWKSDLSVEKIRTVEAIQRPALEKFGYEVEEGPYKPITLRKKLFLMQVDSWKSLFRKRKQGMKDRQIIEYNDSFTSRFKSFVIFYVNLFFSRDIAKTVLRRFNYKSKTKN